jgi:hypothetical protein
MSKVGSRINYETKFTINVVGQIWKGQSTGGFYGCPAAVVKFRSVSKCEVAVFKLGRSERKKEADWLGQLK